MRKLSDKERYDIWFYNNYETGMEYKYDPNNLPDFDDRYYTTTPKYISRFELSEVVSQLYLLPTIKITYDRWLNGRYELIFSFLKWEFVIAF
jgi:hypothetical protein